MKKEVLIIGGGFAGLSAGVDLASNGHHVTVIEGRGHLGGRAHSYRDPLSGSVIDNGQHILMGCYRDTFEFLEKIGTRDRVSLQKNLSVDFAGPPNSRERPVRFQALPLPSPFHLAAGFLGFRGLSFPDKWSALRLTRHFQKRDDPVLQQGLDRKTVTEWMSELGQTEKIQKRFWNLLAFAALNDDPAVSSAALFEVVLREALFSGRRASCIGIPTVGLSDLYTEAARDYIERKGGTVLLKSPVTRLHFKNREFQEAELAEGRRISAEILLVTVPFNALRKILPEAMLYQDPFFVPLSHLRNSPIVAIHLWFDREITPRPFVGLWGTKVHWLFNKGKLFRDGSPPYLSLVISGAREELGTPGPQLTEMAMRELSSIYPEAGRARLLRSMVTKEPEATMAPAVGSAPLRLSQKTPYTNFFLAGDWTDTGLPATIESAVRSAKKAVELIKREG